jgi:nickel transport protein
MRYVGIAVIFIFAAMSAPVAAHAHKVNVFAYAEGGMVYTQSYFADGGPCVDSKVSAHDVDGKLLVEGKTDGEGSFEFAIPGPGELKVVLHAGEGHGNEYTLSAAEIAGALGDPVKVIEADEPKSAPVDEPMADEPAVVTVDADEEIIRRIVREDLDKKMRPVNSQLMDIKAAVDRPGMTETVSGIGYILGILGIILYLRSKKR